MEIEPKKLNTLWQLTTEIKIGLDEMRVNDSEMSIR